jgi:hypothetical protein
MGEAKKINEIEKNLENLKFELDRRFKKYLKSLKGIVKIDPIRRKENLEEYENIISEITSFFESLDNNISHSIREVQLLRIFSDSWDKGISVKEITKVKNSISKITQKVGTVVDKLTIIYGNEIVSKKVLNKIEEVSFDFAFSCEKLVTLVDRSYNLGKSINNPVDKGLHGRQFHKQVRIHGAKLNLTVIPRFNIETDKIGEKKFKTCKLVMKEIIDYHIDNNTTYSKQFAKVRDSSNAEIGTQWSETIGNLLITIFRRNPILVRSNHINLRVILIRQKLAPGKNSFILGQCHSNSTASDILMYLPLDLNLVYIGLFGKMMLKEYFGKRWYGNLIHELTHALDSKMARGSKTSSFLEKMGLPNANWKVKKWANFLSSTRREGLAEIHKCILPNHQHQDKAGSARTFFFLALKDLRINRKNYEPIFANIENFSDIERNMKRAGGNFYFEYAMGEYIFMIIFLAKMKQKAQISFVPNARGIENIFKQEIGVTGIAKEKGWQKLKKKEFAENFLTNGNLKNLIVLIDGKYQNKVNEVLVMINLMDVPEMLKAYKKACKKLKIKQEFFRRDQFDVKDDEVKEFLNKLL